ncbi:MAG: hypothetical protein HW416_3709 [Chloroflexi bacterium]|nr:hypothetical protein [Chloroflexota bacterium]
MKPLQTTAFLTTIALLISACAPAGPTSRPVDQGQPSQPAPPRQQHTLTIAIEQEPAYVAGLAPTVSAAATDFYQRPFNAFLDIYDDQNRPLPYLADALPQLNTESWQVFPDGRMETRYRLKPNLVWHDGKPLMAEDFAFTFRVATPAYGFSTAVAPHTVMDDVVATDDRSLMIRWKGLYPDAGALQGGSTRFGLVPMPRHILEKPFLEDTKEAFQDNPYWSREFIGAGPFKVERWELGSYIEAMAFDQHVLGRPKIDRIRFMFMPDHNTVFANLLAGSVDVALNSFGFQQLLELKREWASSNAGTAGFSAVSISTVTSQIRPDYANPRALRDVRVRRALAHGIDKQTLGETIWGGEIQMMDSIFDPTTEYFSVIERSIVKYPYDPRMTERLMNEAGYTKGGDGFFAGLTEGKLTVPLWAGPGRGEQPVIAAGWRAIGLDTSEYVVPRAQTLDPEGRSTFPGEYVSVFGAHETQQMATFLSSQVASAETRWRGENRTGWVNPEYDRLVEAFNVTLDPNTRVPQRAEIARILTEELPNTPLSYNPNAHAYLAPVKGVSKTTKFFTTGRPTWNIYNWEYQ